MSRIYLLLIAAALYGCSPSSSLYQNQIEGLAEAWIMSVWSSKQAAFDMVQENMDENGKNHDSRYVGFGFIWDTNQEGMIVTNVIAGGPSDGVLEVGDEFLSVNGVTVSQENIGSGKLSFRGQPGVPVEAKILRNGNIVDISVTRGIISPSYSKAQILETISSTSEEDWNAGLLDYRIVEKVSDPAKRIVYVKTWTSFNDDVSGLNAEAYSLIRFEFTSEGKVLFFDQMTEDELVLRQTGWMISR
ncbi:MAG: PDZ domain-containing protein [bacterium]